VKVHYDTEMRADARQQKRPLVTIDVPGYRMQCIGDQQLLDDLAKARASYITRRQAEEAARATETP